MQNERARDLKNKEFHPTSTDQKNFSDDLPSRTKIANTINRYC